MRHPEQSFDDILDYYTLGRRIPGLDDDKEKFRDLMNLVSGFSYDDKTRKQNRTDQPLYTTVNRKLRAIYFSLSAGNPCPASKLCLYPANFASTDKVIARGLDAWLRKYEWYDGGNLWRSEEKVSCTCFFN